jgi:hypothetical protein
MSSSSGSWARATNDDTENQTNGRRALDYTPGEGRYLDEPAAEESDGSEHGDRRVLGDTQQEWASERVENS